MANGKCKTASDDDDREQEDQEVRKDGWLNGNGNGNGKYTKIQPHRDRFQF